MSDSGRWHAAVALHRFALGGPAAAASGDDPVGWLLAQMRNIPEPHGPESATLADSRAALQALRAYRVALRAARRRDGDATTPRAGGGQASALVERYRALGRIDVQARLLTAIASPAPFFERLVLFWSNHFTVSATKAPVRGLVGPFEREAIRPHVAGRFEELLRAAIRHPAMLLYLDNAQSAGPNSRVVSRLAARAQRRGDEAPRIAGLNENLARELLELHTLGVNGGYRQADVTELARVLTGWRVPLNATAELPAGVGVFDPNWHEPGPKRIMGHRYEEGPGALDAVLHALATHPSTARFVATKLVRHLVGDEPPAATVAAVEAAFLRSGGHLPSVYRALLSSAPAWNPVPAKLKTPEEFVVSSARLLGLGGELGRGLPGAPERTMASAPGVPRTPALAAVGAIARMGQRLHATPSPAGWPDRATEWLGPEAIWQRVEWSQRIAARLGPGVDARALAQASLGPLLGARSRQEIARAADGPQALALLLMSPEFQRR